jgi:phosphoethanolamine N-methyltransferase
MHEKAEIISYLPGLQGKRVLDLGAGIGRFTRHFASQAEHLTSADMMPQFVEKNRKDHSDFTNIDYICSDAMQLQLPASSFDFIFIHWLLMYLEDEQMKLLVQSIHRWLKPQGELFFRESCAVVRTESSAKGYYAHYRSLAEYDALVKKRFTLLKEGHVKAYVYAFADPMQCYWHCRKN